MSLRPAVIDYAMVGTPNISVCHYSLCEFWKNILTVTYVFDPTSHDTFPSHVCFMWSFRNNTIRDLPRNETLIMNMFCELSRLYFTYDLYMWSRVVVPHVTHWSLVNRKSHQAKCHVICRARKQTKVNTLLNVARHDIYIYIYNWANIQLSVRGDHVLSMSVVYASSI